MELFIGNLPDDVSTEQVRALLGTLGDSAGLHCAVRQAEGGQTAHYCVATLEPDSLGHKVISQLQGARFGGKPLIVREFVQRSTGKDRRGRSLQAWSGPERRRKDRRSAIT